ncbi:NfeD family protein [Roseomonas xinghualingensis]|uniref:NfeD family protein n=1 Tax=Roseomonas xinghualingensis TaxID=2986475 RepID=UPI0021F0A563|nr:NfeD family protein [Roseomonas sp. SXEYE001]MCV4207929.1 NfeD family protein [Roseomonas sp. SXEYE001]
MEPWLIWILAGLLLLGAELLLPGAFLVWAGLAAIGTGLVWLVAAPGFPLSVVIFVVLMAAGVALALRRRRAAGPELVNTPASGLAGRKGVVVAEDATGLRVRVGDSDWAARAMGGALRVGDVVQVEGVEGTVLRVRAAE